MSNKAKPHTHSPSRHPPRPLGLPIPSAGQGNPFVSELEPNPQRVGDIAVAKAELDRAVGELAGEIGGLVEDLGPALSPGEGNAQKEDTNGPGGRCEHSAHLRMVAKGIDRLAGHIRALRSRLEV